MEIIFHIGLPKTGTTTIQEHLLSGRKGYLGKDRSRKSLLSIHQIQNFTKTAKESAVSSPEDVHRNTEAFLENVLSQSNSIQELEKLILSDEALFGWPAVKKSSINRPMPFIYYIQNYLKPIWSTYGDIRVVVTLRNQSDFIASRYAQGSRKRRNASQKDFESHVSRILCSDDPSIKWDILVEDLVEALGDDHVTVLLFEDITSESFWEKLLDAFSVNDLGSNYFFNNKKPHENKRASKENVWRLEASGALRPSAVVQSSWPSMLPGKQLATNFSRSFLNPYLEPFLCRLFDNQRDEEIYLSSEIRARIREHYSESNQRLGKKLNRDLKEIGY